MYILLVLGAFIIGGIAGIILMCLVQINRERDIYN